MTPDQEYKQKADEVMTILHDALSKVNGFYDCRMILGLLLGIASVHAAGLRQAKVLTEKEIADAFVQALVATNIDGKIPKVTMVEGTGVKQ